MFTSAPSIENIRKTALCGLHARNGVAQRTLRAMEEIHMTHANGLLDDTVMATLAIYAEMRRRSVEEHADAEQELRRFLPTVITDGEANRESLMVKGLVHLRRLENRPQALPVWMRRRAVDDAPNATARERA
jgi:hypothetical protein